MHFFAPFLIAIIIFSNLQAAPKLPVSKKISCASEFRSRFPSLLSEGPIDILSFDLNEAIELSSYLDKKNKASLKRKLATTGTPNFRNTIGFLYQHDPIHERFSAILGIYQNNLSSNEVIDLLEELRSLSAEANQEFFSNKELFDRIEYIYKNAYSLNLSPLQKQMLNETRSAFIDNAALLSKEEQDLNLKLIDKENRASSSFDKKLLQSYEDFSLPINDRAMLKGISPEYVKLMRQNAKEESSKAKFLVFNDDDLIWHIMRFAESKELRRQVAQATSQVNSPLSNHDTTSTIQRIVKARQQRAQMFGFANYADFALQNNMLNSSEKVSNFLNYFAKVALKQKEKEKQEFLQFLETYYPESLEAYKKDPVNKPILAKEDFEYYLNKYRQFYTGYDQQELTKYFQHDRVWQTAFWLSTKMYGLTYKENLDHPKYHPDVKYYDVFDPKGNLLAILSIDSFARTGKGDGAWQNVLVDGLKLKNKKTVAQLNITTNFVQTENSLLDMDSVVTIFHELGHALHTMLSKVKYKDYAGTSVKWDFVELPSQFNEYFIFEPEVLKRMAVHYKTGETISDDLLQKIKKSKSFFVGHSLFRNIKFASIDLAWHTNTKSVKNITEFERSVAKILGEELKPLAADDAHIALSYDFSHIFSGGYAAQYYSYLWSDVLAAHAFSVFKREGVWNPKTANRFRKSILEVGGTVNPLHAFIQFAGEEPDPNYLIELLTNP